MRRVKDVQGWSANYARRRKSHCAKGRHLYYTVVYSRYNNLPNDIIKFGPTKNVSQYLIGHYDEFCIWCEPLKYELLK